MNRNFWFVTFFIGAILFVAPLVLPLEIYNPVTVHNCDSFTNIAVGYTSTTATAALDTSDKVEGSASISVSYSGYQTVGYIIYEPNALFDYSATPVASFSIKVSTTLQNMRLQIRSWSGSEYVDASYSFTINSASVWETKEINLNSPIAGSVYLNAVRGWTFWFGDTSSSIDGQTWKLDNVRVGSASSATPTPSPTPSASPTPTPSPTATPTPQPTPTPTPAPGANEFQVSISPSSTTLLLGESVQFTSTVLNGVAGYTYEWFLDDVSQLETFSSFTFIGSEEGNFQVYLNVTDSTGVTVQSNTATIEVSSSLTPSPSPSPEQEYVFGNGFQVAGVGLMGGSGLGWWLTRKKRGK